MLTATPPAQIQEAPSQTTADRDIVISGFGGVPLKASVRGAAGHPCFAILVPDSGPTDRDWSNPLLKDPRNGAPLPSHAGRDLAGWFRKQGIGSLRYDKRLVGSRDLKLDTSLDAQLGDIRAVIQAARSLPEAKGKRILLAGLGEGALLSLLVASDADAILCLNMPGQSMAGTITEQIRSQIPAKISKPNLAYLDKVFLAIRSGKPVPIADKDVLPTMGTLADSLMAPETLAFVKATLDLDPWTLASRLTVPCALAWGDKDIQDPKPSKIPAAYRGRIIDLPGANHLLKQEDRSRLSIMSSEALLAYGDSTPQADLTPLVAWLKEFIQ